MNATRATVAALALAAAVAAPAAVATPARVAAPARVAGPAATGAADASPAQPYVPKGFVYAARVTMSVTYTARFSGGAQQESVCTDPGTGMQTTTTVSAAESRAATISADYAPIVVPVAALDALGGAARTPALTLAPSGGTSGHGTVSSAVDRYRMNGQALTGPSCATAPWSCTGTFASAEGFVPSLALTAATAGYDPIAIRFRLESANPIASPAGCGEGDQPVSVTSVFGGAQRRAARGLQPPWGTGQVTNLKAAFARLATRASVTVSGSGGSCRYECGGLSSHTRVVLTRTALLRTTRSYGTAPTSPGPAPAAPAA